MLASNNAIEDFMGRSSDYKKSKLEGYKKEVEQNIKRKELASQN